MNCTFYIYISTIVHSKLIFIISYNAFGPVNSKCGINVIIALLHEVYFHMLPFSKHKTYVALNCKTRSLRPHSPCFPWRKLRKLFKSSSGAERV